MLTFSGSHNNTAPASGFGGGSYPYRLDLRYGRSTYDRRLLARVVEREETTNRSHHQ